MALSGALLGGRGSFGGSATTATTGSAAGFCVVESLTSSSKVVLEAGLQLSVGVAMVLLVGVGSACRPRHKTARPPASGRDSDPETVALVDPVGHAYSTQPLLAEYGTQSTTTSATAPVTSDAHVECDAAEDRSLHTRLVTAAVNFALTAYGSVTLAVMRLLHCVHVPGTPTGQQRLYIAGSVVCEYGGWQLPLVAVLVLLCCTPVVLPWVATWSRGLGRASTKLGAVLGSHEGDGYRPRGSVLSGPGHAAAQRGRCRRGRVGVRRALVDAYRDGREYWESVLLAQRLVRLLPFRS